MRNVVEANWIGPPANAILGQCLKSTKLFAGHLEPKPIFMLFSSPFVCFLLHFFFFLWIDFVTE